MSGRGATCPGCGAEEASYHARGCTMHPVGVTECCRSPIWPDTTPEHQPYCPAGWGWVAPDQHRQILEPMSDPWHDATWSPEAEQAHLSHRIGP